MPQFFSVGPFDSVRFEALAEGLEISVVGLSDVKEAGRFDPQFYSKRYLVEDEALARHETANIGAHAAVTDGPHGYHEVDAHSDIAMLTAKSAANWFATRVGADTISAGTHAANLRSNLAPNDIILGTRGTVGRCAIVFEDVLPANIDQDVARITIRPSAPYIPEFALSYLNCRYGQDHIARHASGMVQQGLSLAKVREIPIPLLGAPLQTSVRQIILKAKSAVDKHASCLESAEDQLLTAFGIHSWTLPETTSFVSSASSTRSAYRLDAEFFHPKHLYIENQIAAGDFEQLGHLSEFVRSGPPWPSSTFVTADVSGAEPLVRIRNCKPGIIEVDALDRLSAEGANSFDFPMAERDDIAIGMDGIKWFYAGVLDGPAFINQRVAWLRLAPETVEPLFVQLVLNSPLGQAQLLRRMTIAQTVGHITLEDVRTLKIPRLPAADQRTITGLLHESVKSKSLAARLLNLAKSAVEIAIEHGETAALTLIEKNEDGR